MIIRDISSLKDTERITDTPNWKSVRLLLKKDNMGFSLHDTLIRAGTETKMWYKNHLEAVYCIDGMGEIEDLSTGQIHKINSGVMYALDKHDHHILRAKTDMRMICVFNPPCVGNEIHDEEGAYPLIHEKT
ncbi:MAG TPA: ectoine synthase [Nitrosopumilaceae archaeon]|nr:ectoine synthase [Nitrosopumilaceae archaeon]